MIGLLKYITIFYLAANGVTDPRTARQDWAVVSVTYGGTVSIEKNLSLRQASQVAEKLDPNAYCYHGLREIRRKQREQLAIQGFIITGSSMTWSSGLHGIDEHDIKNVWVIGPEGWENGCMEAWSCE